MFAISRQDAARRQLAFAADALIFAADIDATPLIITLFAAADTSPLLPPHCDFDSLRRRFAAFVHAFRLSPLPARLYLRRFCRRATPMPLRCRRVYVMLLPELRHYAAFAITPAILIFFEAPRHLASRRFLRRLFSPAPLLPPPRHG
jgi:hypothetical protein